MADTSARASTVPVVFWKVDDATQSTEDLDTDETDENARRRFLLRYYRVWNLEQCELPQAVLDKLPTIETHEHDPIEAAERIIAGMPNPPEIQHAGSKAFYSPITDRITLPPRELFASAEEYYATALHETVHSTGHQKRLAREGICEVAPFGSAVYSKEELCAEMGAAYLCAGSRHYSRSHRESGRVRGRLAQEASRRSQAADPRSRASAARRGLYPPGPARCLNSAAPARCAGAASFDPNQMAVMYSDDMLLKFRQKKRVAEYFKQIKANGLALVQPHLVAIYQEGTGPKVKTRQIGLVL